MGPAGPDIYFLVFASIFLFFSLIFFLIILFNHYRRRQRQNYQEKEELKTAFRNTLLQSQLEIQEQTFNDISQEIHDNVGQLLSLAKIQISIMNESDNVSRHGLDEVKQNISHALDDLRNIARSLSSDRIRTTRLHTAISAEAERINKSGLINITLQTIGEEREINEQKKLILFRIIQESLQNIIKHAQARQVNASFLYQSNYLEVAICDNGRGFDVDEALKKNTGLGLNNIRTRALLTGGSCQFESELNKGTTITIKIPYD